MKSPIKTSRNVLEKNREIPLSIVLLLVLVLSPTVRAQTNSNNNSNNNNGVPYANFSPSMAIIIVVLVAALFFMGFFSIYIRQCSDSSGSSVRNVLSMHARRGNAARGLEASVIETFPTFSYAEVKEHQIGKATLECAVCLNEFEDDEKIRLIPKCDHVFHPDCIDAWLESHVTCPVCRADLTPQPDDHSFHLPETNQQAQDNTTEPSTNNDVIIEVPDDRTRERSEEDKPRVNRNLSFNFLNRPPRTESVRRGRTFGFGRFRSHSTGHSLEQTGLIQPGENVDRFTLRLPEGIRQEMMNRALLNRTKSSAMGLPRAASSRRGYRAGLNDGSNRGGRSFSRIDRSDQAAKSDRWLFSKAQPFFSRALSIRSPRVMADEGSTSKSVKTTVKMPSFKCLEPKSTDETVLVRSDPVRPPV